MEEIDLGDDPKLVVKLRGESYEMTLPDVRQAQAFSKKMSEEGVDELEEVLSFLAKLGLPVEVAETLRPAQLEKLTEGMLQANKKK